MLTSDEILTLRTHALRNMAHGGMRTLLLRATDQLAVTSEEPSREQVVACFEKWGISLVPWQRKRLAVVGIEEARAELAAEAESEAIG